MIRFIVTDTADALEELKGLDYQASNDCEAESFLEALNTLDTMSQKGFNHVRSVKGWEQVGEKELWLFKWRCISIYYIIPGDGRGETHNPAVVLSSFCQEHIVSLDSLTQRAIERVDVLARFKNWG